MKFAIGDDVGQLKVITASRGTDTSLKASARPRISTYFTPDRKDPVYAVCKIDKYQGEERAGLVAVVFTCGKVKLVDTSVSPVNGEEKYLLYTHTSSTILSTTATASPVVSAGVQHGILYLFRANGEVVFYRFDGELPFVKTVPLAGNIAAGAIFTEELVNGWPSAIAIGGEKRDLEVFEPTTEGDWKSVWKAKNVKQDKLGLEVPVYIRRILFLGTGGGEAEGDTAAAHPRRRRTTTVQTCSRKYRLATGTQHSHLRIYDAAFSRRPIFTTTLTKSPILSLHLHPSTKSPTSTPLTTPNTPPESSTTLSPHNWIYTDSNGHFALYNSTTRREAGIYQGSTGAVNATATFSKDIVTGVGFDRYLRVYEGSGREIVVKAYVRSKGTAVVVLDGGDEAVEVEKSRKEEEEEVWGEMDEVGGGSSEGGGEEGDFTDVLVKVRRRRPRTDKEGGGSKKRRLEV
ncbi:unnamed protein product [Tuber melanosporum]|uniref:(Perigord truffle) hypothetical protein n=1 Tax=Tuber melanosporum (strain Mel28) TaxID=656061 RepID=D5GPM5_TUBMM|nr:uncharacterized protein GSTUM_00011925001 [Tuber melanosporum]CAZ86468.1 unnamed protein product [Tuber melanosporum]